MARQNFDADFNDYIRRTVKSFNQRVIRAERRGMKNLPSRVSVRQLKARYTTKKDLKRELNMLRKMNQDPEAMRRRKLGDTWIVNWEYDYLKYKLSDVKDFYNVMVKMAKDRYQKNPDDIGLRDEYVNLEERIKLLDRNLDDLSYSDLRSIRGYINKYENYGARDNDYFDTYFSALQTMLENSSLDAETIRDIKAKVNQLTPQEFSELVRRHDVVNDIFKYIESPKETFSEHVKALRNYGKLERALKKQDELWMAKFGIPIGTKNFKLSKKTTQDDIDNFLIGFKDELDENIQEVRKSNKEIFDAMSESDKRKYAGLFGFKA